MWPYSWTHVGTPSHLGHMDRVAATMPSQAHAGAAQEAPNIGQWEGQDVPLVRPSSCTVKGGIPSSRRYLPTYLFQELMNKMLYILRRRPLVQELISRAAEMEAHIDDMSLGTNTQGDHILLLQEFFTVCQENHLRIKPEKCEFMREEMEYLGFDVAYGWWKPAASKMQPLQDMQIGDDPKKVLHHVGSFIGACNFYRRHIDNFKYSSALRTDLIKKTNPWRWTDKEEACFQELKKKISSTNCLGYPALRMK